VKYHSLFFYNLQIIKIPILIILALKGSAKGCNVPLTHLRVAEFDPRRIPQERATVRLPQFSSFRWPGTAGVTSNRVSVSIDPVGERNADNRACPRRGCRRPSNPASLVFQFSARAEYR